MGMPPARPINRLALNRLFQRLFAAVAQNNRGAGFPTCRNAGFQIGGVLHRKLLSRLAICDTADLEVGGTVQL